MGSELSIFEDSTFSLRLLLKMLTKPHTVCTQPVGAMFPARVAPLARWIVSAHLILVAGTLRLGTYTGDSCVLMVSLLKQFLLDRVAMVTSITPVRRSCKYNSKGPAGNRRVSPFVPRGSKDYAVLGRSLAARI